MATRQNKKQLSLGHSFAQILSKEESGKNNLTKSQKLDYEQQLFEIWRVNKVAFCKQVLGFPYVKPFQAGILNHKGIKHAGRWYSLALCPRKSGKSYSGTIGWSAHQICIDPDTTGLICSESKGTACLFIGAIKTIFETNVGIMRYYGNHVPHNRAWNSERLISAQRKSSLTKESTVEALGAKSAIVGRHVEWEILDDVFSPDDANSPTEQKKLMNWYDNVCQPVLNPGGMQLIRGTRYSQGDFYGHILKRYGHDVLYHIKALQDNGDGSYISYYPEKFPVEDLLQIREANPVSFEYQYQNSLDLVNIGLINLGAVRYIDESEWPDFEKMLFYIGVDPATGTKGHNDYFATCTCAYDQKEDVVYVLKTTAVRLGDPFNMLKHINQEWWWVRSQGGVVSDIRVETTGFQKTIIETQNAFPAEFGHLPLSGTHTEKDKVICLQQQAHWINLGKCVFDRDATEQLTEQLLTVIVTGGHDDIRDAFLRALEAIEENSFSSQGFPVDIVQMQQSDTGVGVFNMDNFYDSLFGGG